MQIIDTNTVMVDNFSDLSSIITANSDVTYVYLGEDITMTSGIQINNGRTKLTIDGEYPIGSGIFHTLTDAGDDLGMIYKSNISPLDITLKNMTIKGLDYFGMPRIANGNVDVTITYQNVTYTGPQITWHWSGKTRYIDCNITIEYAGRSPMEQVGEICQVEIGGRTTINHTPSSGASAFQFYNSNASLTILKNADVNITTNNDFFIEQYPPSFTIESGASLNLTTQKGISRSSTQTLSSLLIDSNASFIYTQLSNADGNGTVYIDNSLIVNSGAIVYMQADFTSSVSTKRLIQFTATASSRQMQINNPKSFVLYNKGPGTAIYFGASTEFSISGQQVNYWRDAAPLGSAGTFDDLPLYPWHNPSWSNFDIIGSATTASTTVTSTTLNPATPDFSNLKLHEARVLSVGNLPLTIKPVVNDQTPVMGNTDIDANIKVSYTDGGITENLTGTADGKGEFSIPTPAPISIGTVVTASANIPFLYITKTEKARYAGVLYVESAPDIIKFVVPAMSTSPMIILGRRSNEPVVVYDDRVYSSKWDLMATISGPMFCESTGHTLPGKVTFVPSGGTFYDAGDLEPGVAKKVYTGGPRVEEIERTSVVWLSNNGILLHLTGPLYMGDEYLARLDWTVTPVAEP